MISVSGSRLLIGGIDAAALAEMFGTPLYVYDGDLVVENYRRLWSSIDYREKEILYAVKANNNPGILEILRDAGSGLDTVSPWEVLLGLGLGFRPEKILFTGVGVSDEEMALVRGRLGVMVNIDSISQLKRYGRMFPGTEVSLRINTGVGAGHHRYSVTGGVTKFGIFESQLGLAQEIAREHKLRIVGIHTHIGSGFLDPGPFLESSEALLRIAERLRDLEFVDFGGGFGIPYRRGEAPLDIEALGKRLSELVDRFSKRQGALKLRLEPGRLIVGSAGVLLTRVVDVKRISWGGLEKIFVIVDTGLNHLIRPALYGAYHEVIPVGKADRPAEIFADVVGNICESGDVLAVERQLPRVEEGDLLAIMDVGAYGYSMSSNYNLRPRPAEVLVRGGSARLVRRRERLEDLLAISSGYGAG